jgi:hypothetical protein
MPAATSSLAWLRTPSLAVHVATADCRVRAQAASLQPNGSRFQTRWFLHVLTWRRHKTVPEPFSYPARRLPGTGGAFTASADAVPLLSTGTAKEVGPLTSDLPAEARA